MFTRAINTLLSRPNNTVDATAVTGAVGGSVMLDTAISAGSWQAELMFWGGMTLLVLRIGIAAMELARKTRGKSAEE